MKLEKINYALRTYSNLSDFLKSETYDEIVNYISTLFYEDKDVFEDKDMGYSDNKVECYKHVLNELIKNIEYYDWMYEHLGDDTSKITFNYLMNYRLVPNMKFIENAYKESKNKELDITNLDGKNQEIIKLKIKKDVNDLVEELLCNKDKIRDSELNLEICVSGACCDIWKIARLIYTINPNYVFYLRHYNEMSIDNTILYAAIKLCKIENNRKENKRVVSISGIDGEWNNAQLMKDCGIVPYMFHKLYGYDVTMVGDKSGEYPYLDNYLKGMKMDFLDESLVDKRGDYIRANATEIDVLVLYGAYQSCMDFAFEYKRLNPNGKVLLNLDDNSYWMDNFDFHTPEIRTFFSICDVITSSCRAMQRHLNRKWPIDIEYMPHGFYNDYLEKRVPVFEEKENKILTVGRLGTEQKATMYLVNSFIKIAEKISDWKLCLIGSMEEQFKEELEKLLCNIPEHISERIEIKGIITDKQTLYEEYLSAKIFALTSTWEGGTPNVIAEALQAGCAMLTTKIDAFEDAIDKGKCGLVAEISNVDSISEQLLALCKTENLKQMSEHAYEYALDNYDYKKIIRRIHRLMFGE